MLPHIAPNARVGQATDRSGAPQHRAQAAASSKVEELSGSDCSAFAII